MHVEHVEGLPDQALIDAFNETRVQAYAELEPDVAALEHEIRSVTPDPEQHRCRTSRSCGYAAGWKRRSP